MTFGRHFTKNAPKAPCFSYGDVGHKRRFDSVLYHVSMANQDAFKSNKNLVYSCKYQVVWTPKYRRKVLVRGVDERLKEMVDEVADELQCEVLEREVMPDHVHMLCEVDPQFRFIGWISASKENRSS
jgi:hypothetical protein